MKKRILVSLIWIIGGFIIAYLIFADKETDEISQFGDVDMEGKSSTVRKGDFNDSTIGINCFQFIRLILPRGSKILELGSGLGTRQLAKFYTMYSIENDRSRLQEENTTYFYAPIRDGWYDRRSLFCRLPQDCDLLLIDGPSGKYKRSGILKNLDLFDLSGWIIVDDINRKEEAEIYNHLYTILERNHIECLEGNKAFGVIFHNKIGKIIGE